MQPESQKDLGFETRLFWFLSLCSSAPHSLTHVLAQAPSLTASGTGFPLLLPFPPLTLLPRELLSFPGQMTLGQAFTFTGSEIGAIITPILQAGKQVQ